MPRVLVVDDEAGVRESLRMVLRDECELTVAGSVAEALASLRDDPPDLVLLDLVMPGRSGLELLSELKSRPGAPAVVVLTGTTAVATAVEAMKQGAADYLTKPFEVEALRIKVRQLLERRALEAEVQELRAAAANRDRLGGLIGRSEVMHEVFRTIRRIAGSRATVLIRGESGTGKELAARAIHALGPRRSGPFVAVNCAGIPDTLIESELFGHERGAFTDARERRIGRFEAASGGTLFLDEIGELAAPVQAKLLRALQERSVDRVGGSIPVDVDVRVVAATQRDLEKEVEAGRFRADLYYRIHVVPLELPPLRERRDDIRPLTLHVLERVRTEAGRGPTRIAPRALDALERFPWPGNVRELANAIERAVALSDRDVLELADLPPGIVREGRVEELRQGVRSGEIGVDAAAADFEREIPLEVLERCAWNQTRAAGQLQVTRRALKLKMDRYRLAPPG
jgi:DNA-binding NtrC family response regulator